MQNQHNEQKKSRNQNPAPQDCKHPQSKKQEQPQDKTGDPNRHCPLFRGPEYPAHNFVFFSFFLLTFLCSLL